MLRPRFDKDDWEYETFSRDFRLEFLNKRVKEECIAQSTSPIVLRFDLDYGPAARNSYTLWKFIQERCAWPIEYGRSIKWRLRELYSIYQLITNDPELGKEITNFTWHLCYSKVMMIYLKNRNLWANK